MNKLAWLLSPCLVLALSSGLFGQDADTSANEKKVEIKTVESPAPDDQVDIAKLIDAAATRLVEIQEEDGAWPYEGVYRVPPPDSERASRRDFVIPVGYRIGGSAIVCSALISARLKDRTAADQAIIKSTELILRELESPLMMPSQDDNYDVRVWGHIYALDYFCRLKEAKGFEDLKKRTDPWIGKLADALVAEEIKSGGWNYAGQRRHASFVTAPALQSLLFAQKHGANVPPEVLQRGARILSESRVKKTGAFQYSGTVGRRGDTLPGSIARAPISEATMIMLGTGDQQQLQNAIDQFHEHWNELEKRRKKTGTHLPPHGVAPYYFYYGHRYLAQAIRMLPVEKQDAEFDKFVAVLMKTKDPDNTWNDRVFDRSKAYGTAMSLLALARDSVLMPPRFELKNSAEESKNSK